MKIKIRPAILLGELLLGLITYSAMVMDVEEVALVAVGAIAALLPKIIESEEK